MPHLRVPTLESLFLQGLSNHLFIPSPRKSSYSPGFSPTEFSIPSIPPSHLRNLRIELPLCSPKLRILLRVPAKRFLSQTCREPTVSSASLAALSQRSKVQRAMVTHLVPGRWRWGGGCWAGLWREGGSSSPESSSKRVRERRSEGRGPPEADLGGAYRQIHSTRETGTHEGKRQRRGQWRRGERR